MSYTELLKVREDVVDEVGNWMWVKEDDGAWAGPHREWMETHRDAYLRYVKERNVVVQAGGNCGLYPRLFAKYFQTVYTFEPDPLNFHCLVNNCQQDNIIKINGALGDVSKLISVRRGSMTNVGTHTVGETDHNTVPQFTIDQLKLTQCDLFQLDVEGYEPSVLRGAIETINKFKPVISCENGGNVREFLVGIGYRDMETVGADTIFVYNG